MVLIGSQQGAASTRYLLLDYHLAPAAGWRVGKHVGAARRGGTGVTAKHTAGSRAHQAALMQ
jgi:hypothetical protein